MNGEYKVIKSATGKFRAEHHVDGALHPSPWFDTEKEAKAWVEDHDKREAALVAKAKEFAKANGFEQLDSGHWLNRATGDRVATERLAELAG